MSFLFFAWGFRYGGGGSVVLRRSRNRRVGGDFPPHTKKNRGDGNLKILHRVNHLDKMHRHARVDGCVHFILLRPTAGVKAFRRFCFVLEHIPRDLQENQEQIMAVERHPMTPFGYQQLKAELKKIREIDKPANVAAIEEARAHGDLSENAEYTYAKEQQGFIYGREKEVEALIATAEVIDPTTLSGDRIVFGATVHLLDVDTDEETTYTIVGENEADSKHGRISVVSPIARALIGKRTGDEAIVNAPKGRRTFEVLSVEFLSTDTWQF